jgi:hypothetical protein
MSAWVESLLVQIGEGERLFESLLAQSFGTGS